MMMEDEGYVASGGITYAKFDPATVVANVALSDDDRVATSSVATAVGNHTMLLDINPTTGLWAFEINNATTLNASMNLNIGLVDRATVSLPGVFPHSVGIFCRNGTQYLNSVQTASYWTSGTSSAWRLIVIDPANRRFFHVFSGALKASGAMTGTDPCLIGVGFNDTIATAAQIITLNAGQQAFTAGNEALMAAYELTNGVTINRGVWI